MQVALNGFTTACCDLLTDIELARKTGFDLLEIRVEKLRRFLCEHGLAPLEDLFRESGVRPLSINALENVLFRDRNGLSALEEECRELCDISSRLGCPYIIVVPSRTPAGVTWNEIRKESVTVLRRLAGIAKDYGVSLSFEFMGFGWCAVNKLGDCTEIVRIVDRRDVGLVLDMFHFFAGGSSLSQIRDLDVGDLHIVHINDAPDLPPEKQDDRNRLLPGEGIIPIPDILKALRGIAYDGPVSVEVLQEEYWKREPFSLCEEARTRTLQILDAVDDR